jgi:hypothetical protein
MTAAAFADLKPAERIALIEGSGMHELWGLVERVRQERAAGAHIAPTWRQYLYNAWFTRSCAEGNPPYALRRDQGTEEERFWARTIPGLDGCVLWDGEHEYFRTDTGTEIKPERWSYRRVGNTIPVGPNYKVVRTCKAQTCVNPEHLALLRVDRRRYSDTAMIGGLQALALQLGHTPTTIDWEHARRKPDTSLFGWRFGSWAQACRAAGLEPPATSQFQINYSTDELVGIFQEFAQRLGHTPSKGEWRKADVRPSTAAFERRFGNWTAAVLAAGCEPRQRGQDKRKRKSRKVAA